MATPTNSHQYLLVFSCNLIMNFTNANSIVLSPADLALMEQQFLPRIHLPNPNHPSDAPAPRPLPPAQLSQPTLRAVGTLLRSMQAAAPWTCAIGPTNIARTGYGCNLLVTARATSSTQPLEGDGTSGGEMVGTLMRRFVVMVNNGEVKKGQGLGGEGN